MTRSTKSASHRLFHQMETWFLVYALLQKIPFACFNLRLRFAVGFETNIPDAFCEMKSTDHRRSTAMLVLMTRTQFQMYGFANDKFFVFGFIHFTKTRTVQHYFSSLFITRVKNSFEQSLFICCNMNSYLKRMVFAGVFLEKFLY